jgi:hypothetical protein
MLLTHEKFAWFTIKKIADGTTAEALIAIAVHSRAEVDRIANAALKVGAQEAKPSQDYGFRQLRSFLDLDGHHREILYMDPAHAQPQTCVSLAIRTGIHWNSPMAKPWEVLPVGCTHGALDRPVVTEDY